MAQLQSAPHGGRQAAMGRCDFAQKGNALGVLT